MRNARERALAGTQVQKKGGGQTDGGAWGCSIRHARFFRCDASTRVRTKCVPTLSSIPVLFTWWCSQRSALRHRTENKRHNSEARAPFHLTAAAQYSLYCLPALGERCEKRSAMSAQPVQPIPHLLHKQQVTHVTTISKPARCITPPSLPNHWTQTTWLPPPLRRVALTDAREPQAVRRGFGKEQRE